MYILDTDHLSLIQRNGIEGKRILARLAAIEEIEVAVTPFHLDSSLEHQRLRKVYPRY